MRTDAPGRVGPLTGAGSGSAYRARGRRGGRAGAQRGAHLAQMPQCLPVRLDQPGLFLRHADPGAAHRPRGPHHRTRLAAGQIAANACFADVDACRRGHAITTTGSSRTGPGGRASRRSRTAPDSAARTPSPCSTVTRSSGCSTCFSAHRRGLVPRRTTARPDAGRRRHRGPVAERDTLGVPPRAAAGRGRPPLSPPVGATALKAGRSSRNSSDPLAGEARMSMVGPGPRDCGMIIV
jgi:hypothetical protein